ncbi:MAG: Sua5/YciO/YrdC/YwlC family protein, partial [bacterium]|nr:Sua5/YciO/YrdC/YwlC family protein [bacterium]
MQIIKLAEVDPKDAILSAIKVLENGGLVVFPSETMYGIGADATSQKAIDKLLSYKARREGKPLSIAVSSVDMAAKYVLLNNVSKNLYKNFLP